MEEDFRLIAQWGFNFVRLPMDYRTWIQDGDWTSFNEAVLQEIDQAVAWGEKYGWTGRCWNCCNGMEGGKRFSFRRDGLLLPRAVS